MPRVGACTRSCVCTCWKAGKTFVWQAGEIRLYAMSQDREGGNSSGEGALSNTFTTKQLAIITHLVQSGIEAGQSGIMSG